MKTEHRTNRNVKRLLVLPQPAHPLRLHTTILRRSDLRWMEGRQR